MSSTAWQVANSATLARSTAGPLTEYRPLCDGRRDSNLVRRGSGHGPARLADEPETDGDPHLLKHAGHASPIGCQHGVDMMLTQETGHPGVVCALGAGVVQHVPRHVELLPASDRPRFDGGDRHPLGRPQRGSMQPSSAIAKQITMIPSGSGEREEQLLQLGLVHRGNCPAFALRHALLEPLAISFESRSVEGARDCRHWVTTSAQSRPFSSMPMTRGSGLRLAAAA